MMSHPEKVVCLTPIRVPLHPFPKRWIFLDPWQKSVHILWQPHKSNGIFLSVSLPPRAVRRGWELAAPSIDYQHLTSGRNGAGASFVGVEPKNEAFLGGNPANDEAIPQSIPLNFAKFGYTTILTTPKITTIF